MMKKVLLLLFLFFILIFTACSVEQKETKLTITNKTNYKVWISVNSDNYYYIHSHSFKSFTWVLNSGGLTGTEHKDIHLHYNGYTTFIHDTTLTVSAGDFKTFDINPEGGCIMIKNTSDIYTIEEIYISPSDSLYWGENLIDNEEYKVSPQDSISFTCEPDFWDIKLVDDFGEKYTYMETPVNFDEITTIEYVGDKKFKSYDKTKKVGKIKIEGIQKN